VAPGIAPDEPDQVLRLGRFRELLDKLDELTTHDRAARLTEKGTQ
jgi:hypothetical protein